MSTFCVMSSCCMLVSNGCTQSQRCTHGNSEILHTGYFRSIDSKLVTFATHTVHTMFTVLFDTHVPQNTSVGAACSAFISHSKFLQINIELQVCTVMCSQNKPGVSCYELRPLFCHSVLGTN